MAKPGHLEHPSRRLAIIRALAADERASDLARKYEVSDQSMSEFKTRHAEEITAQRERLDDEFAALWVAKKANRILAYQQQVDEVAELMADPDRAAKAGVQAAEMLRVAQTALKAVADELGQIPARMQVEHSGRVEVVLNGVDTAALQ